MIWLMLALALLMPSLADAACTKASTTFTCTGDIATLRALYMTDTPSAILEGDTVSVSAGTWSWTQQLISGESANSVYKAVPGHTFQGAGEGVTIFQRDAAYSESGAHFSGMMVFEVLPASGLTTVTGFTLDLQNTAGVPTQGSLVVLGTGLDKFRVHHVTISNLKTKGFVAYGNVSATGALELSGLFDHNTCNTSTSGQVTCFYNKGSWSSTNQNGFLFAPSFGSNHSIYFENNTCNYSATADDCADSYLGGNTVWRYNTANIGIGFHGADSGLRGPRQLEIYRNTFTAPISAHYAVNFRSGPNLLFENTYTNGTFSYSAATLTLQRPTGPYGTPGTCNGLSLWDGNLIANGNTGQGWPCLDQTGWLFTGLGPNGANAIYAPAYFFKNTVAAASLTYTNNDQATSQATNYITANRDYYAGGIVAQTSASSPFDGTTGVGFGTLARRPATCTTGSYTTNGGVGGVGYWATDQGSWNTSGDGLGSGLLYKCTATNTWTLVYTPYAYPHPLQGAAPAIPAAPTSLRAMVTGGGACTVTWAESGLSGLVGYHLSVGTSTGVYDTTVTKTVALSTAARQPLRQHTFRFHTTGTYYISVTAYSDTVGDSAAATEITCAVTVPARTTRP